MAKDSKFGTFGGVFTPSILTILGVIMYLRVPWVTGHAGLITTLGIVVVAHVISIATGLSISSIATDKNVGAGGPYYIVSRSLGLPIGGALGLALFIGLGFSASLYVIGFSESFLGVLGIDRTPTAIRITGTITLISITAVTIISTAFAIKTQYLILALIGLSLFSIFLGDPSQATAPADASREDPSVAALFGIFFPAVTGFTAGVNMSGDLRDPKKSIPSGTMAAIFTGLFVYIGLVIYLAKQVPQAALVSDPDLLSHIAWRPEPVTAGIWGATLSSGLGSMMGAPRILQALSRDAVTPRLFARGRGPTHEPRNALVVAFLLAEAGILIAELDAIARIVSMVFLTMYGFLNLSCAIEAAVSPDFRPSFRIPKTVSVLGFATCLMIMIQLDLVAMTGAVALMIGLFLWLQRRQLELESGDAWEGIWSSIVRSGLYRLTRSRIQQRNWRPNIVSFCEEGRTPLLSFSEQLVTGNGLLTRFSVDLSKKKQTATAEQKDASHTEPERKVGVFHRKLRTDGQAFPSIRAVVRHYGFSGLEPNTLLLDWSLQHLDPIGFLNTITDAEARDFNVLVYSDETASLQSKGRRPDKQGSGSTATSNSSAKTAETQATPTIDVWWRAGAGNVAFSLALLRFITRSPSWEDAELRFLLANPDAANSDNLRTTMRRLLRDGRIEAQVKIVSTTIDDRSFPEQVKSLSQDSELTIIGLPNEEEDLDEQGIAELQQLIFDLQSALLIRGSTAFPEVLPTGRSAAISSIPPLPDDGSGQLSLPELSMPEAPDLAEAAREMSESYQRLVGRLHDQCLRKVYGRHVELVRRIETVARKHLTLDKSFSTSNPRRQRNTFNRLESSLLLESQQKLAEFVLEDIPDLRSIIEGGEDAFLHDEQVVPLEEVWLTVRRPPEDFKIRPGDSRYVRRFKRRRRFISWVSRRGPTYKIPLRQLRRFYFKKAKDEILNHALAGLATESHQLVIRLSRVLNSTRAELLSNQSNQEDLEAIITAQRDQLLSALSDLNREGKQLSSRQHWSLIVSALHLSQSYADDIQRLDFQPLLKKQRQVPAEEQEEVSGDVAAQWQRNQTQLLERARLSLSISSAQHRLATIVHREREALLLGLKSGALRECERLKSSLVELEQKLGEGLSAALDVKLTVDGKNQFDPRPIIDGLMQDGTASLDALPPTVDTLTDEAIQALEEGRSEASETVELPVRRLMQFLLESELIAAVQEQLSEVPRIEQRALTIAQDAARLVSFQMSEFDREEPPSAPDFAAQLKPAVQSAIERIDAELERLRTLCGELDELMEERLRSVIESSHPFELTRASDRLLKHMRVRQGRRAVSGLQGWVRRIEQRARSGLVRLLYQKSESVLLAQKRRAELPTTERTVDVIAQTVRSELPQPEVLEALPFYYRQLFMGQSGINDTFWVGRKEEIIRARQALKSFDAGKSGALIITGDRLSGKSALLQRLGTEVFDRRHVVRVHAPAGGSTDAAVFDRALLKGIESSSSLGAGSSSRDAFALLPRGSVVFIDDAQLWWQRSTKGLRVLRKLTEQIERQTGRVLFVFVLEAQAFRFINRLVPLADRALSVLTCGPVSAETLQTIVTLRHASTGMKYRLGGRSEEELGSLLLARHFSHLFDESRGNIGAALRMWISEISKVRSDVVEIVPRSRRDFSPLDTLRTEWIAILTQLLLHKQITEPRLAEVTGLPSHLLTPQIQALVRMGLVAETQKQVIELQAGVVLPLTERLTKRGILP